MRLGYGHRGREVDEMDDGMKNNNREEEEGREDS